MYETYTYQSLPEKDYRLLLGTALCVFNSNNGFIIEHILSADGENRYNWWELIDLTSGKLLAAIKKTIDINGDENIANLFCELVDERNRIVHSFRITNQRNEQTLATKTRDDKQFEITEEYLKSFIEKNDQLSRMLDKLRGF